MDDLIAFLSMMFDDEEQAAREALKRTTTSRRMIGGEMVTITNRPPAWRAALWTPERVLAEIDAKRRLLEQFRLRGDSVRRTVQPPTGGVWDDLLRMLALPYAGHPAYREEWRP